jgi:S-adenosylmethionine hydrolase
LTDFGEKDAYVAQLKGAIKSINPKVEVLDLSHVVPSFDVEAGSYLLEKAARYFPGGTAFVVVVDPEVGTKRRSVVVCTKENKFYVGPDNGIFTRVILREGLREAREIANAELFLGGEVSSTFHGRDIFGPVAARLSKGMKFEEVGPVVKELVKHKVETPTVMGSRITGRIVHVDQFGNVITNIQERDLKELKEGQLVQLTHGKDTFSLPFCKTYGEAPEKRLFALLGSDGELEFAYSLGDASKVIGGKVGDQVVIKF